MCVLLAYTCDIMACPVCEKVVLGGAAARVPFCSHKFHIECLVKESLEHGTSKERRRSCSRCPKPDFRYPLIQGGESLQVNYDVEFIVLLDHLLALAGEIFLRCLHRDPPPLIDVLAAEGIDICDDIAVWAAVARRHFNSRVGSLREALATLRAYLANSNFTLNNDMKRVLSAIRDSGKMLYIIMMLHIGKTCEGST
eukprot:Gregarina_sp_Poly_1__6755@NODE_363_length_9191_cov_154_197830_g299_i0_p6_GENE_NODE_363_length_9191_cov_154_197830_g299_i0NODE_363_length_9191_cov_154_197830_g299_i0_p6_ORF_typecomplete_len197_score28_49zfRING_2/PF13639_6/0_0016zfRING_11/PF17123_5/0_02YacG/PF03884_14/0_017YacG/PF03884_14/3_9e03zfRINGlike/PF08746_11/0_054zfRINGlike/PF08746_11/5e03zfC3HC4_2/PF13923_6/0_11zfC3HC4/PF00097_25/0_076zfC3HC4/PF00097_25/3_2e03FANCL_C/PF11793_8/0_17Zn_ribbon_17/PF17120_5/0_3zfANAPC11/PF12861_7/0_92zfRING_U